MAEVGQLIGAKYRLERRLGAGGMGEVFEATNVNTGRRVAIKVLRTDRTPNVAHVERFLQEARVAACIQHPNVIDVFDLDLELETGAPYIVQEFLVGETLEEHLRRVGRLAPEAALALVVPVMEGLVAAHEKGVVHRDLKPGNIFLTRDHTGATAVKVIDFGIAKIANELGDPRVRTATGSLLGTPAFMSPEQAQGGLVDAQTDVWAIGVVLYLALTGRYPFDGENIVVVIHRLLHDPFPRPTEVEPSLPLDLEAAVLGALERDRTRRFASMQVFLDAVLATRAGGAMRGGRAATPPTLAPGSAVRPFVTLASPESGQRATLARPARAPRGTPTNALLLGGLAALVVVLYTILPSAVPPDPAPREAEAAQPAREAIVPRAEPHQEAPQEAEPQREARPEAEPQRQAGAQAAGPEVGAAERQGAARRGGPTVAAKRGSPTNRAEPRARAAHEAGAAHPVEAPLVGDNGAPILE